MINPYHLLEIKFPAEGSRIFELRGSRQEECGFANRKWRKSIPWKRAFHGRRAFQWKKSIPMEEEHSMEGFRTQRGAGMGQIANQMAIEWCHRMIQKIKGMRQKKKDKKQAYGKTDAKERE